MYPVFIYTSKIKTCSSVPHWMKAASTAEDGQHKHSTAEAGKGATGDTSLLTRSQSRQLLRKCPSHQKQFRQAGGAAPLQHAALTDAQVPLSICIFTFQPKTPHRSQCGEREGFAAWSERVTETRPLPAAALHDKIAKWCQVIRFLM